MSEQRERFAIPDSRLPVLADDKIVGKADAEQLIGVTLHLRHAQEIPPPEELESILPHQRRYLTPEEFDAKYGMLDEDLALVEKFAVEHRLRILAVHRAPRTVELEGTVHACNRAFGVDQDHRHDATGTFRAHEGTINIPIELAGVVEGVTGLDTRSRLVRHRSSIRSTPMEVPAAAAPQLVSYFPREVAALYNFPLHLDGAGQTVGIFAYSGGYFPEDLEKYCQLQGLPVPEVVTVPEGSNKPDTSFYSMEISADVQTVSSIAPGAKIVIYFCSETNYYLNALKMAIHDQVNRPSVMSISYGYAEEKLRLQDMRLLNRAFAVASMMGITVCVASGDGGSATREYADFPLPAAHVNFPASCPFALACGGTSPDVKNGKIVDERVWNYLHQCVTASGGGISTIFQEPLYQNHAALPPNANPGVTFRGRGVPDVAANASHTHGYNLMFNGTLLRGEAGTSFCAPLWSALIALLNQGLGYRLGHINPALYKLARSGALVDITKGDNGAYRARPGWDACTGLGRPDGTKLLAALKALGPPTPPAPPPADPCASPWLSVQAAEASAAMAWTATAAAYHAAASAKR
jgi:kumamolisin